jgi:hypothetical protein
MSRCATFRIGEIVAVTETIGLGAGLADALVDV